MKEYDFKEIESKWQKYWSDNDVYKVDVDDSRPKYYVLDMFPYPSGAGLHVGHPLGYIASDIYSRYKRQKGFNVLHPMGYDAFGLPAEQYAIQTGQHPAVTTEENINRYRSQLDKLGFCYDWSREVRTCSPEYYKWTQWAFEMMFNSYYDKEEEKAKPISELISKFEKENTYSWNTLTEKEKEDILEKDYRLAYQAVTTVNWCEGLGTVLANDEVKDGLSVRGGFEVQQRPMKQWLLRVSAYAERLEKSLQTLQWSDSLKEIQRNWIGRSEGATIFFPLEGRDDTLEIFTTRCDTIFGVTFMVLAPEHPMVESLTTEDNKVAVQEYKDQTSRRSERERIAETKIVSGCFTGSYAINPFNGTKIPIYISDYVLVGYGTGAIMAVPAHDSRDYAFAKHFSLPIIPIIECDVSESSYDAKEGKLINSDFLTGLEVKDAIKAMFSKLEEMKIGYKKVNYRLRDAIFSRQRYWGEPFPVYYEDGIPKLLPLEKLPLELPAVESFKPSSDGRPPLANVKGWQYETSTMPGFAGSSAYYLRYMDPHNTEELVSAKANKYWRNVDLYVGGTEHATGHLIYSRFWNKFLYDLGYVCEDEPFQKLINQGMIQGQSKFVYRIKGTNKFVSYNLKNQYDTQEIHVDVNIVDGDILDTDAFKNWRPEFNDATFELEDGKYVCGSAVEKMSKSMYNVVNPDSIVEKYGADTLRAYEMFLGPIQMSKPWDTKGIEGVHKFFKKFWRMAITSKQDAVATKDNLKSLHKCIKKVNEDIENFSYNTSISAFMICLNELSEQKAVASSIFKELISLLQPFAPHITAELWSELGFEGQVVDAPFPVCDESYLVESSFEYPVSINGKMKFKHAFSLEDSVENIEKAILADQQTIKFTDGKTIKKVIIVKGKIINIVVC